MGHRVESSKNLRQVILASSVGTVIEWYDFYIFGALATVISGQFFPKENPTAGFLATLATFATGFIVRPFGAIVFGRAGDLVGRKYTFLLTLLIMGGSTFAIGLLPSFEQAGVLAPVLLVCLRLLQGLALGGEYGGAATYVAEHSPDDRRGYYTSFIQTTATIGLLVSIGVILAVRLSIGEEAFGVWGWRVPFLLSVFLVMISYYIRIRLQESPVFVKMKAEGKSSTQPLRDAFGNRRNLKLVLLALFGATAGQGCIWYTGQFYALTFLQKSLNIEFISSNLIVAAALVLATPLFLVFGHLSDKWGRKKIMLSGCLLGAVLYLPIYYAMKQIGNPEDLTAAHVPGAGALVMLTLLVFVQVVFVTMVYGPIAAFLVELFPTRIRYTSMSLPYHVGNGVFGGLTPFIATAVVAASGNMYLGLAYPIGIALLTVIVGALYVPERVGHPIDAD
jgi:MFS family permease